MPLNYDDLVAAAARGAVVRKKLVEAAVKKNAFLCHSHFDKTAAEGLQVSLSEQGWNLYIDWKDASLPAVPTVESVHAIQAKIQTAAAFLFLATFNSEASRWCPWELGYADGKLKRESIFIVPTERGGKLSGAEYFCLYRRINLTSEKKLAAWDSGQTTAGILIEKLR